MRQIQLRASHIGARLFRNNVGIGWTGKPFPASPGDILLRHARRIRFGLFKGSSDQIGWRSIVITPEMVGKTIAQFVSIEVKDGSPTSKDQMVWLQAVIKAGGIGVVAHSVEDAVEALTI